MDVRLSAEQRALRESAVVLVDRLRAKSVGELADRERASKLDAAIAGSGWRELRAASDEGGPWSSAVEVALVAEELGRGAADAAFIGPTLAAELRRLAAAPAAAAPETVIFRGDLAGAAIAGDEPAAAVAIDAAGSTTALLLVAEAGGYALAEVPLGSREDAGSTSRGPSSHSG